MKDDSGTFIRRVSPAHPSDVPKGRINLPKDMRCEVGNPREVLEAWGIVLQGDLETDDLFQVGTLPSGWEVRQTENFTWSMLVDDKGRERASIYYKSIYGYREAYMVLTCRFTVSYDHGHYCATGGTTASVLDSGKVIHTTGEVHQSGANEWWLLRERAVRQAEVWLDENYPDWRNPAAYWDD